MGHPRRFFQHKSVYFVTNRLAEGLPFVANAYVEKVLGGVFARARERFPSIGICSLLVLGNHYHGVFVTKGDPADLERFFHYVHAEVAKILVRWLGKRNVKVWGQRYNAAKILDFKTAVEYMGYLFLNPSAANLVDKIEDFACLNTWQQLFNPTPVRYKRIRPSQIPRLPNGTFTKKLLRSLLSKIGELETREISLQIEPFLIKECFQESVHLADEEVREQIVSFVRAGELKHRKERKREKREVAGADKLAEQNPHKRYKPKKYGKRMFCLSRDKELRLAFIELYKCFCEACSKAWHHWLRGNFNHPYPAGGFLPPRKPVASSLEPVPLGHW